MNLRTLCSTLLIACFVPIVVFSEFYPERIYRERTKANLDFQWKFYKGTPSGNPFETNYNDNSWKLVNVPHSASYDAPTPAGERGQHIGICWYRKKFKIPEAKHKDKLFLEFEGAMQIADVWLNGQKLGTHDNSGYTWFSFDITEKVSLTGDNVLAVRLDNQFYSSIPPGMAGASLNQYPDYYLYSGIYRDVWLVATNKVHIPLYGQQVFIDKGASTSSAKVRIKTTIKNDDSAEKNVTIRYILAYDERESNAGFLVDSIVKKVKAGEAVLFDKTCGPINNPKLWSPETPYLYRVFTQVFVDGKLVDDFVERFGVRWFTWTSEAGFALNGKQRTIRGVNLHQSIGWIGSALSNRRLFEEVELCKEIGADLIRTAHFPRDPSFYNACDEIGLLSMVEVPTWGNFAEAYPDSFWIRMNNVVKEMIEVGYNHPSIISWGLFNEPKNNFSAPNQVPLLNKTAHEMDSTRLTFMALNRRSSTFIFEADIAGLNYGKDLEGSISGRKARTINTEYHEGWLYWCFRGGENDNVQSNGYADERWKRWIDIKNYSGTNKLAGGCMWSFNDYWSPFMDHPMGVVDHYRVPKAVFYLFREKWTGVKGDYPEVGITPTKLELTCDMDTLLTDSVDISIITAALRDANGKCAFIGKVNSQEQLVESTPITFTISGPADHFGDLTVQSIAGKAPLIIKSKNTTGTIKIKATSSAYSLTSNELSIAALKANTNQLPWVTSIRNRIDLKTINNVFIKQTAQLLKIQFTAPMTKHTTLSIVNLRGQNVPCPITKTKTSAIMDIRACANGCYFLHVSEKHNKAQFTKKIFITR